MQTARRGIYVTLQYKYRWEEEWKGEKIWAWNKGLVICIHLYTRPGLRRVVYRPFWLYLLRYAFLLTLISGGPCCLLLCVCLSLCYWYRVSVVVVLHLQFIGSEDIIRTNIPWRLEPSLWLWPWRQQSKIVTQHSGSWWYTNIQHLVAKGSKKKVQEIQKKQLFFEDLTPTFLHL